MTQDERENKRVEYQTTHDTYLHYDNYSWQVGSILIAGVFVYWGFLLSISTVDKVPFFSWGNILVTLIMSIWYQYSVHNRQIYLYKLHRIHELELELGMEQHLRFRKDWKGKRYITSFPSGHLLNAVIYIITSAGGLIIGYKGLRGIEWHYLTIINLTIIVFTLFYGYTVERTTKKVKKRMG